MGMDFKISYRALILGHPLAVPLPCKLLNPGRIFITARDQSNLPISEKPTTMFFSDIT